MHFLFLSIPLTFVPSCKEVRIGSGNGFAPSHDLNQCWPNLLTHKCIMRRKWVNYVLWFLGNLFWCFQWYRLISEMHSKSLTTEKAVKCTSNFVVIIVPADGLAPWGSKTSGATIMINFRSSEIILCMCPTNERHCYNVTSSLIGWAHSQNHPWVLHMYVYITFMSYRFWHFKDWLSPELLHTKFLMMIGILW